MDLFKILYREAGSFFRNVSVPASTALLFITLTANGGKWNNGLETFFFVSSPVMSLEGD